MLTLIKQTVLTAAATVLLGGTVASAADVKLNGAGATFPEPVYQKWIADYGKTHPNVKINYAGIGSGGGIKGITDKTLDFAGSDAPMNKKEIAAAGGEDNLIEVPSVAGGVVPAYNIPGVTGDINFSGEVLADIYLGKITKWNDPALTKLNPKANLPDKPITPAWRTDGSGTTFVWTNYLATQSKDFTNKIGVGKQVKWPAGAGGQGNQGVAAVVKNVPGAIGYLEQQYATGNNMTFGAVLNKSGKFVKASPEGVSAAGAGAAEELKGHILAANIWNQKGDDAYPIASFTYLIVYKDLNNVKTADEAQALVDFLWYATHEGQQSAGSMSYAPLAAPVQKTVEAALAEITYKGQAMKSGLASK